MVDEWLRRNSTSRRIRKRINTHTSFLPNANPTFNNFQHQDEIPHLNQQPKNGVPPQSLTWKLENDGFQVRWTSPFSRWVIFQVNHVHPTEDSTEKGTWPAITTRYFDRNFMIIWSLNLQGSSGFIRQQILPTCTQKITIFSSILKFPSPSDAWRDARKTRFLKAVEVRRQLELLGTDEGGFATQAIFLRIFLGEDGDLKKMGKDWKIFGFWNLEIVTFRFRNVFFD